MARKAIIFDLYGVIRPTLSGSNDHQLLQYTAELRSSYKIGLLSNIGTDTLAAYLKDKQFADCFDVTIASGSTGFTKPHPEAYLLAAHQLGVEPADCLMVDDSADCCEGAREVGMQAHLYTTLAELKKSLREQYA